jgi:TPR repeat protein
MKMDYTNANHHPSCSRGMVPTTHLHLIAFLAVTVLAGLGTPALADLKAGQAAFDRHDYATALAELLPSAEQGDTSAQFQVGWIYLDTNLQNYNKAIKWLQLAADKGHANAQFDIALTYHFGRGRTVDIKQAAHWYLLAAEQGIAEAQLNVGMLYDDGNGVTQDFAEAAKWYRLAATNKYAEHGHAVAQYNLGALYYKGLGVPQNLTEAAKWFQLAADRGYAEAQYNLGSWYYTGTVVEQDYVRAYMWFSLARRSALITSPPVVPPVPSDVAAKSKKWCDIITGKMSPAELTEAKRLAATWKPARD